MRLEVEALEFKIRSRMILKGLDFVLTPGISCLLGPNGAGKSTLLRILATILTPDSGWIRLMGGSGQDVVQRDRLGYVPQSFAYYANFTTRQMVEYIGSLKGISRRELESAAERALADTNLVEYANHRLGTLSGGTLQRAAIAQAIVNEPDLLILDEPTAGLDPSQRRTFTRMLRMLSDERIVILSTHLVEDVTAVAQRVLILVHGRIVFDGNPFELAGQAPGTELSTERLAEGYEKVLQRDRSHAD